MNRDIVLSIVDEVTTATGTLGPDVLPHVSNAREVHEEFEKNDFNPTTVAAVSDNIDAVHMALAFDACNAQEALDMAVFRTSQLSVIAILSKSDAQPTYQQLEYAIEYSMEILEILLQDSRIVREDIELALACAIDLDNAHAVSLLLQTDKVSSVYTSESILRAADQRTSLNTVRVLVDNVFARDYTLAKSLANSSNGERNHYNTILGLVYDRFDSLDFIEYDS